MTKTERRQLWMAVHRYLGLMTFVFLAVAAATGCLLCFEKPLDRALNPALFRPQAPAQIDPLIAVEALERARPALAATYFPMRPVAGRNILVAVEAKPGHAKLDYDQVFLDGADGHIVGTRDSKPGWDARHVVRGIYWLHFTLLAGTAGRWLMGGVALAWLIGNGIGVYLTWPTIRPYFRRWWKAWTFKPKGPLLRISLDLHRTIGLWLLVPLTALAFTSVMMNFFDEVTVPIVGHLAPPDPSPFDAPPPLSPEPRAISFQKLVSDAEALAIHRRLGWRAATVQQEPDRGLLGVRFTHSGYDEYRKLGPVTYWFDPHGRFVHEDSPYADSAGMAFQRSLYPLHTGEMIGPAGIAFDLILGLATLMFTATGVYLWIKRRRGRVAARKRNREKNRALRARRAAR
jgi:uncharacterized iron-regulated membrane protein